MGKKAKKRKEAREILETTVMQKLSPNEGDGQVTRYMEDPKWEMMYMNPSMPIYIFRNKDSMDVASIGDRQACLKFRDAMDRVLSDEHKAQGFESGPN